MLKDLSVCEHFMKEYLKTKGEDDLRNKYEGAEISIHVLSSNSWPI
jgi:hypothetical protein